MKKKTYRSSRYIEEGESGVKEGGKVQSMDTILPQFVLPSHAIGSFEKNLTVILDINKSISTTHHGYSVELNH